MHTPNPVVCGGMQNNDYTAVAAAAAALWQLLVVCQNAEQSHGKAGCHVNMHAKLPSTFTFY
jgi:hypothetical protein